MGFCTINYPIIFPAHAFTLENYCTLTAKSSRVGCSLRGHKNYYFWFTVIHSMSKFFTAINFHDVFFFIWNYHVGIVVHSGLIGAFKF